MAYPVKNCRTCRFASWHRNARGARDFKAWAGCTYAVPLPPLPASRDARRIELMLTEPRSVASYGVDPVNCPTWAPTEAAREVASDDGPEVNA